MFGSVVGRSTGVGIPEGQRSAYEGIPGDVLNFAEAKTYAVQYTDADGRVRTTLAHRIGGVWHLAPNGENYAATLKPLVSGSKLSENLEKRYAGTAPSAPLPGQDAVDVLGTGS